MGNPAVRAWRDRDAIAPSPAWRQGRRRVSDRRFAGGLRKRGDRCPLAVWCDQHRHAGHLGQGLGRAASGWSHRISDELFDLLREYEASGTPCALATVVRCGAPTSAQPGDKAVITADGRLRGWIGGSCSEPVVRREALRALAEGAPQLIHIVGGDEVKHSRKRGELMIATTCPSGGSLDIFIEPRLPKPLLLVFGDSPAAGSLSRLAELTGFRARIVSQAEMATLEVGPGEGYAVVATMGHYDEDALETALGHPDLDVSLIASTRRAAAVRDELLRRGIDEHTIARIRTPAGKVRGGSQEEIALLALAEVVMARRKHGAKPAAVDPSPVTFVTDLVCGMTVDPLTSPYKVVDSDQTYWFCSAGCQASFEKARTA
ncbi:MAG: YHS domain-containing protein [Chloroflexi bacterium]|nr:MAG: YHS domain-containing protein [Chloroflexota bacterium]